MKEAYVGLWWVPAGHRPSPAEAEERVAHLRERGPTAFAFTFKHPFASPGGSLPLPARSDGCPV